MTTSCLQELTQLGTSVWLDDLSRDRLTSGNLSELIRTSWVRGVTTNPAIFQSAISTGAAAYADQLAKLTAEGNDVDQVIRAMTTDDVRNACLLFSDLYQQSGGVDGRVSIEVDPRLAHDTEATIRQATELAQEVGAANVLIKIPATLAGLPAITAVIGAGISVNVTLIFSVERYLQVVDAYMAGLELALAQGLDLSSIHSVASFFVSRVDSEVDKRLADLDDATYERLRGKAGLSNARLAWAAHIRSLATDSWAVLTEAGANAQRPLWASTGVKDPAYPDTMYVTQLAVRGCVNTMPASTLHAVADHGEFLGDTCTDTEATSLYVWSELESVGISAGEVCDLLETEGVQKFIDSWESLRGTVSQAMQQVK